MTGRTIRPRPLSYTERIPVIFLSRGKDGEDEDNPALDPALEQYLRSCEEARQQQQGGLLSGLEYSRACKKRRLNKPPPTSNSATAATSGAATQPIAVPTCRDIPDYDANLRALAVATTRRAVEGVPGGPASSSLLSDTSPSLGGLYTVRGTPLTAPPQPHAHLAADADPPTSLSGLADAPPDPADAYIIYQEDVLARDQRRDPSLLQYDMDEEDEVALKEVNAATAAAAAPKAGGSSSRPPPATRGAAAAAAAAARSLLDADSFEGLVAALEQAHFAALQQRKELWEAEVKAGRVPKLPRTDKVLPWEDAVAAVQRHQPPLPPLSRLLYQHWLKRRKQENGPLLGYLWYEQPWKAISFHDRSPGREGQQGDMPFMATETKNSARGGWSRLRIDKSDVYSRLAEVREELELLRTTADQVRKRERLKKQLLKLYRAEVLAKLGLTHHSKHSHAAIAAPHVAAAAAPGVRAADPAAGTAAIAGVASTAGAALNPGGAGGPGAGTTTERSRKRRRVPAGGEGTPAQLEPPPADLQPQQQSATQPPQRGGKNAAATAAVPPQPQQPPPAQLPSQSQTASRGLRTGKARAADAAAAPACPSVAPATGAAAPRLRGVSGRLAPARALDPPPSNAGGEPHAPLEASEPAAKRDRITGRTRPNVASLPVKQAGRGLPAAVAAVPTAGPARGFGRAAGAMSKGGEENQAGGPSSRRGVSRKAATPSSSSSSSDDDDDDDSSGDASDGEGSGRAAGSRGDANSSQIAGVKQEEGAGCGQSDSGSDQASGDSGSSAAQADSDSEDSGSSDDNEDSEEDEEGESDDSNSEGGDAEEPGATGVLGDCGKGRPAGMYALRTRPGAPSSAVGTGRKAEPPKAPTRTQKPGAKLKTRQPLQPTEPQDERRGTRGRVTSRREAGPRTRARSGPVRDSSTPPSARAASPASSASRSPSRSPSRSSSPKQSGAAHTAHASSSPEYSRSLSHSPPPPSRAQPARRTHNGVNLRSRGLPSNAAAAVAAAPTSSAPYRQAGSRQPQRPRPQQAALARRKPHSHVRLAGQIAAVAAARARQRSGTTASGSAAVRRVPPGGRKGTASSSGDNTRQAQGTTHKKTSRGWRKELTMLMGSPPEATAAAAAVAAGNPSRAPAERRERAATTVTRLAAAGAGEPAAAVAAGGQKRPAAGSVGGAGTKVKDSAGANAGTKVLTRKRKTLGVRNGIAT